MNPRALLRSWPRPGSPLLVGSRLRPLVDRAVGRRPAGSPLGLARVLRGLRPWLAAATLLGGGPVPVSPGQQTTTAYVPPPLDQGGLDRPRGFNDGVGRGRAEPGAPANVIRQPAKPVVVGGKPASELSDDEIREFLEGKIKTIEQEEGQVELLRIAPGYALTLTFEEPVQGIVLGDPALVSYHLQGQRTLVLAATQRGGDTSMTLLLPGNRLLSYHVFIAPDFVHAQTSLKVVSNPGAGPAAARSPYLAESGEPNLKAIIYTVANYDALLQERAIDRRVVRRFEVFRRSTLTAFVVYDLYRFAAGPVVVTFAYTNPFPYPVRYDESRLRVQLGNVQYVPDFTTLHRTVLPPRESTTGLAVVIQPALRIDQPFELVWK